MISFLVKSRKANDIHARLKQIDATVITATALECGTGLMGMIAKARSFLLDSTRSSSMVKAELLRV
jgi:hypothetical protein